MRITIHLSNDSINNAISELERIRDNILDGLKQTVEILVKDGETIAQSEDGSMATVVGEMTGETSGRISASGKAAVIAEFGAGDTVINPSAMFENAPLTDVYPGAYSLLVGNKEYATYGAWHFGGVRYTNVEPRMGLFWAKEHIVNEAINVAQEVITL